MKTLPFLLIATLLFGISTVAFAAKGENYSSTLKVFRDAPATAKFFNHSYGYAVFPSIGKAGYVIGGSYGTGQVYRDGKVTGKSSVIAGSIGFQIGGEVFSEIIFFKDKRAYDKFTSGNFEFGADAQAVAITTGAQAQAGTDGTNASASAGSKSGVQAGNDYVNGTAPFVHTTGGLMVGVSVGGQKFTFDRL